MTPPFSPADASCDVSGAPTPSVTSMSLAYELKLAQQDTDTLGTELSNVERILTDFLRKQDAKFVKDRVRGWSLLALARDEARRALNRSGFHDRRDQNDDRMCLCSECAA